MKLSKKKVCVVIAVFGLCSMVSLSSKVTWHAYKSLDFLTTAQAEDGHDEGDGGDHSDGDHSDGDHGDGDHSDGDHSDGEHSDGDHSDGEHSDGDHGEGEHGDGDHGAGDDTGTFQKQSPTVKQY